MQFRQGQGPTDVEGRTQGHLRRRGRRGRGGRGAAGDQRLPRGPAPVPGHGGEDPQGRPAVRAARHGQDPAGPGRGGRGRRAVLLDLGLGLRRDVRRCRRQPGARPVPAGQAVGAGDHLRRRDRRRRPPPRRRARRRSRRARADAQPAARRDGRLRRRHRRDPDRRHQPARHPRPGLAAPGPLRPPDRGRSSRPRRPPRILAVHAEGKPLADDVNLRVIARRTPGFTGADLANTVNEAALLAARRTAGRSPWPSSRKPSTA